MDSWDQPIYGPSSLKREMWSEGCLLQGQQFPARKKAASSWQFCTYIGGFLVIVDVVNVSSKAKISYFHHIVFSD